MSDTSHNNKRIAKNTLLLYVRMFFTMAVGLYTSRVVLQVLGVEDFGIYNVVGGIVTTLGVLNNAMAVSTQRYLSFEMGRGDAKRLKQTFSVCFSIFVLMSLLFVFLAETVGLWFLNTYLVIPDSRMDAANWIYQFTIISTVFNLISTPYNAAIISHEKMDVYAYISIVDVVLKLGIVYLLLVFSMDKLILYGFMLMLLFILNAAMYFIYCVCKYSETRYRFYWNTEMFRQLGAYSGWNIFGSLTGVAKGQGLNILLNMFFNPAVNAARGIAFQVNNIVSQFFMNFFTAVRPQIIMYYAQKDLENMFSLVFRSSKFSYYLILLVSLPICIEAPFIINLWLGQLPEYVVPFLRLIVIITAIDATANPIMTTAHATGRIALYQSLVGTMQILNIPISYVFLFYGASPLSVFWISAILTTIAFFTRIWIVRRLMPFPVKKYIVNVCGTIIVVTVGAMLLPGIVHLMWRAGLVSSIVNCVLCVCSTITSIYLLGLTSGERTYLVNIIRKRFHL